MSVLLLQIPNAIWHDVLIHWLGGLQDIVRVDCATSVSSGNRKMRTNQLHAVYGEKAFPFCDHTASASSGELAKLSLWMLERNVYISCVNFMNSSYVFQPLCPLEWEGLLRRSAETIQSFSICYKNEKSIAIATWASRYLQKLQYLQIQGSTHCGPDVVNRFMLNNSSSLLSVLLDRVPNYFNEDFTGRIGEGTFPNLHTLCCSIETACDLLPRCPQLISLHVGGKGHYSDSLVLIIAESCPLLHRLLICNFARLNDAQLLQIARACPQLEYLSLRGCDFRNIVQFPDVVSALPCLHTLAVGDLPESVILEIGARGHPSLRVLDTGTAFTPAGLRQITAGLPQLTGLAVANIIIIRAQDCSNLFEYCGNLQDLHILSVINSVPTVDRAVQSIANHCSHLQILVLGSGVPHTPAMLEHVLEKCRNLRKITVRYVSGRDTHCDPRVIVGWDVESLSSWW